MITRNSTVALCLAFFAIFSFGERKLLQPLQENPPEGLYNDAYQFIFFAVLEGCYLDGVNDSDLSHILPRDESGNVDDRQNFVFACQSCSASFDGFSQYAQRKPFLKQKKRRKTHEGPFKTFGSGLDPEIKAELAKGGQACRDAMQKLVQRWVEARIVKLRLTDAEQKELRAEFTEMRKEGEKLLEAFKNGENGDELEKAYANWENRCPNCDGAAPKMGIE